MVIWLVGLVGLFVGWLFGLLVTNLEFFLTNVWLFGLFVCLFVCLLFGLLVTNLEFFLTSVWLFGWFGLFVCWLVGWLVGWLFG